MRLERWEISWARRVFLLCAAGVFATLLGIVLSVALARPAGAAALPSLPATSPLPLRATTSTPVPVPADPAQVLSGVTAAASGIVSPLSSTPVPTQLPIIPLPIIPLPIAPSPIAPSPIAQLPVSQLPIGPLPVITKPATDLLTTEGVPSGTTSGGLLPGTGSPANASTGRVSGPLSRHARSTTGGSVGSLVTGTPGSPVRPPTRRVPSPSVPVVPSNVGDTPAPGHGSNPWNALPLTILLLTVLFLGGVSLKRRLSLKLLFDSRFAPPG